MSDGIDILLDALKPNRADTRDFMDYLHGVEKEHHEKLAEAQGPPSRLF